MVTADELIVAQWPDGVALISVVRPMGDHGAEHVFEIRRHAQIVAVCETLYEAAKLIARRLPAALTERHTTSRNPVTPPASGTNRSGAVPIMTRRWRLVLTRQLNYRGEHTLSVQVGPEYNTEAEAVAAKHAHPEWRRTIVESRDAR